MRFAHWFGAKRGECGVWQLPLSALGGAASMSSLFEDDDDGERTCCAGGHSPPQARAPLAVTPHARHLMECCVAHTCPARRPAVLAVPRHRGLGHVCVSSGGGVVHCALCLARTWLKRNTPHHFCGHTGRQDMLVVTCVLLFVAVDSTLHCNDMSPLAHTICHTLLWDALQGLGILPPTSLATATHSTTCLTARIPPVTLGKNR
jgi:hypothetical protein